MQRCAAVLAAAGCSAHVVLGAVVRLHSVAHLGFFPPFCYLLRMDMKAEVCG